MRKIHKNIPVLFEPNDYLIVEKEFKEENNRNNESIFNVANGYIGMRGFFEEGFYGKQENCDPTTMINGIYEYYDYNHVWQRPGFPPRYHAITNQANPIDVKILIDKKPIKLDNNVYDYSRVLDMRDGTITRTFKYHLDGNKIAYLTYIRFASQDDKHLLVNKINVKTNFDCKIEIISRISQQTRVGGATHAEIGSSGGDIYQFKETINNGENRYLTYKTKRSKFDIIMAISEKLNCKYHKRINNKKDSTATHYTINNQANNEISIERFVVFATKRDYSNFKQRSINKAKSKCENGYEVEYRKNKKVWDGFWNVTDVSIDKDELVQQGIRFGMFNMFSSVGKDGITNISANGITGTAYSGHYFWDTEIFMEPMFLYTNPEIAKKLIEYRYNTLDGSRQRAKEMDHVGALVAWNTISGEECGHVFEAATAHYHINADVGYSIYKYYEATHDYKLIEEKGAELLFELGLCLSHRGDFIERKGNKFCLNIVCGPDEYNPVVDNNLFTNMMVKKHFEFALQVKEMLNKNNPLKLKQLMEKCHIDEDEFKRWDRIVNNMYFAYDYEKDMYMQDDSILFKDPIDIDAIPPSKLPLLFSMHPLNLWRFKVCKQADIVLLTFLLHEWFTPEMRKKIFDVYEPLTIHDSSLSSNTYSIVACDIGYYDEAYDYLKQASRMDLDNVNKNTFFGLHAACMGSCWMMLVNGYAGLRIYDGMMHFKPYCDKRWNSYSFKLKFMDSRVLVKVSKENTFYQLLEGNDLIIDHKGKKINVTKQGVVVNG